MFRIAGLKVTVGQTLPIASCNDYSNIYWKELVQFRDGPLGLGNRRSGDGGKTWTKGEALGVCTFQFPDGEIISAGYSTKKLGEGLFEVPMKRSTDGGKTFKSERARLNIPQGTGGTGDDGKYYEGPTVDHAIVALRRRLAADEHVRLLQDRHGGLPRLPAEVEVLQVSHLGDALHGPRPELGLPGHGGLRPGGGLRELLRTPPAGPSRRRYPLFHAHRRRRRGPST